MSPRRRTHRGAISTWHAYMPLWTHSGTYVPLWLRRKFGDFYCSLSFQIFGLALKQFLQNFVYICTKIRQNFFYFQWFTKNAFFLAYSTSVVRRWKFRNFIFALTEDSTAVCICDAVKLSEANTPSRRHTYCCGFHSGTYMFRCGFTAACINAAVQIPLLSRSTSIRSGNPSHKLPNIRRWLAIEYICS